MEFHLVELLSFFSIFILLWIIWRKRRLSIFTKYGIPGPEPKFLTGNLNDINEMRGSFDRDYHEKYGDVFGYFYGSIPHLSISDVELIKTIQVKDFGTFSNRDPIIPNNGIPHPIITKAFANKEDEEWKQQRSMLSPSFSSGRIKQMSLIMNKAIDVFLEIINEKAKSQEHFDIYKLYKKLTLDVTARTIFGVDTDVQKGKHSLFVSSMELVLAADSADLLTTLSVCFPEMEPIQTKLSQIRDFIKGVLGYPSVKVIHDICRDIIKQRKTSQQKRKDLLQGMMDEKVDWKKVLATKYEDLVATTGNEKEEEQKGADNTSNVLKLSDEEVMANSIIFMSAGYDTTSSTLGFISYLLSVHQDVQDKVRDEIKTICGEKGEVTYNDLANLQYLDQVLSETLRLYPVTSATISRICKEEYKYQDKTIPKGVIVTIPTWKLHRDPTYWTNPDKFMPERFSPGNKDTINTTVYQPFGNGPRNCIGLRFAQVAIKLIIARLLMSYRLEYASKEVFNHCFTLFLVRPEKLIVQAVPLCN